MKRNIFLISLLFISSIVFAEERFARVSSSDNTTPTPEGCAKVIFAISGEKIAKMTVKDANGNEFYMESQGANKPPYFYFIPYGEYTVVKMEHIATCSTAGPRLTVGSTFISPNVGYFTMTYDATDPPVHYNSFEYIRGDATDYTVPEGCAKVVFAVDRNNVNVASEMVVENEKGELYKMIRPVMANNMPYYYFIPHGIYKVISMKNFSRCNTASGTLTVGSVFYVNVSGHTSVGYFS